MQPTSGTSNPVHPRARGEYDGGLRFAANMGGSSPRTRGIHNPCSAGELQRRFIPAHAGNTAPSRIPRQTPAVHPRARGEYASRCRTRRRGTGSSPRTRGILRNPPAGTLEIRFIPAHAGNTDPFPADRAHRSVHPRARGEYVQFLSLRGIATGSSPRTRGIRAVS